MTAGQSLSKKQNDGPNQRTSSAITRQAQKLTMDSYEFSEKWLIILPDQLLYQTILFDQFIDVFAVKFEL